MKVLIACEESQTVCKAFRARGMKHIPATSRNPAGGILNGTFWVTLWKPSRAAQSSPWTDRCMMLGSGIC